MNKIVIILKKTSSKEEYLSHRWRENYLTTDIEEAREFESEEGILNAFKEDQLHEYP